MGDELSRRDFLRGTAVCTAACAAGAFGLQLAGCAGTDSQNRATGDQSAAGAASIVATANDDGTLTVAGGGTLKPGAALLFTLPQNQEPAFVFVAANGDLRAVSAKCTHVGCTVEWQSGEQQFVCPCHKSRFSAQGAVLNGPAKLPLPRFAARAQGKDAIVTLKPST